MLGTASLPASVFKYRTIESLYGSRPLAHLLTLSAARIETEKRVSGEVTAHARGLAAVSLDRARNLVGPGPAGIFNQFDRPILTIMSLYNVTLMPRSIKD